MTWHDDPNSHWQVAFFKNFPTLPRFCMEEVLVVPSWGFIVPEGTLSYAPQSRSQTQTSSLPPPKWSHSWDARLHWSVFENQSPDASSPELGSKERNGVQEL